MTSAPASDTTLKQQAPLLVGIGSALGDDQAGWIISEQVKQNQGDAVLARTTSVPLDLLDWITPSTDLHIVDACDGNELPGHLYRWDWHPNPKHARAATETRQSEEVPRSGVRLRGYSRHAASSSLSGQFLLRGTGTHDFDIVSVLELARRLGRLPQSVTIWGVQGERWEESESLSPTLAAVLPDVSQLIGKELVDARTITGTFTAEAG